MENFVVFVSRHGKNHCKECEKYNGIIYAKSDKRKPHLPIHPNCRCYFKEYSGNLFDKNELIRFLKTLPEATQAALETSMLTTGYGEMIGVIKAATLVYTEFGMWLAKARSAVRSSPKAMYNMTEILLELENANSRKDLKKVIQIYNKYK